jgi:hypothetical protein
MRRQKNDSTLARIPKAIRKEHAQVVWFRSIGDNNEMERNLPMKPRFATLRLVFALCAIVTLTISKVSGQDANYEKAVAHATQIIKTKILPEYETKGGRSNRWTSSAITMLRLQNILMNLG